MRVNGLKINVSETWGVGVRHRNLVAGITGSGFSSQNTSTGFLQRAMKWHDSEIKDNLRHGSPELIREYYENW